MSLVMRCGISKPKTPSLGHLFSCAFLHLLQVLQLLLPQPSFPLLFLEAKSFVFGKKCTSTPLPNARSELEDANDFLKIARFEDSCHLDKLHVLE